MGTVKLVMNMYPRLATIFLCSCQKYSGRSQREAHITLRHSGNFLPVNRSPNTYHKFIIDVNKLFLSLLVFLYFFCIPTTCIENLLRCDWLVVYPCCSHLEHRESMKRFVSLQFLTLRHSVGLFGRVISPSEGRYLKQKQSKHKQTTMPWVGF
jgi:hypothetical protein